MPIIVRSGEAGVVLSPPDQLHGQYRLEFFDGVVYDVSVRVTDPLAEVIAEIKCYPESFLAVQDRPDERHLAKAHCPGQRQARIVVRAALHECRQATAVPLPSTLLGLL